ncbi:MAG: S9 family peptidase [Tannerellaceae bacterium]|jgi:dipeptidyl aminopeptidase/acylaminoacyl peptidase|nr:S9 family peptidase [Tannerellaceae bacterium]
MRIREKITIVALLTIITLASTGAQTASEDRKPVGIDFFTQIKSISNLKEKDGKVFFVLGRIGKEGGQSRDLYQLIDDAPVRIASNVSDYFFEDGGDGVIFSGAREKEDIERIRKGDKLTIFNKLSSTGYQEASEWLRLPFRAGRIEWIDKDHFFYISSYDHHFELLLRESGGDEKEALGKKEAAGGYRIFDELPFWSNGRGDVSGLRTHLYYYDNGDVRLLTDTLETVASLSLSPDKRTLVYTGRKSYYGKAPDGNSLTALDVATFSKKEWPLFDRASYGGIEFIDNNEIFLTINRSIEHDRMENPGFYRLNLSSGSITEVYDGSLYNGGSFTVDKDGAYYLSTVVDRTHLARLTYKDGGVRLLTKGDISLTSYIPYKGGFLLVATVGQGESEIYFLDKATGSIKQLTSFNTELFAAHTIIEPIEITFKNNEGRLLNGYVLPPAGYVKGKKYPGILNIHGGPKSVYKAVFTHEMQYWAAQGYAVFFTNPRGSDGRGADFADIRGKIGTVDYDDLMDFVDAVIEQTGFVDGDRLGVTGGSYGGVMTNWIVGHTDRFKAAASQRSTSSWLTFSTTSDIGHTFTHTYFGADIWNNTALLWDRSPLKYADKVSTPTLFLHSDEDYRCWLVEGLQMYYALQYFSVPSRMIIFKGETHELSRSGRPQNRIKRLHEITNWFNKYL